MFNLEHMQQMIWSQFARITDSWPPEMREAMRKIEVDIVKQDGSIRIIARSQGGEDENIKKAREVLLNALINPVSRVIGAFQCKVVVYK